MAVKTVFKDAIEKTLSPSGKQTGSFNGPANPSDGGSDIPFSPNQYASVHPAPAVPFTPTGKPVFKVKGNG